MASQSYSLNHQGRWRRVPWGRSSWPPFVPLSLASPREWVVGLYPWERACSSSAAPVYWARYCPLVSQVPFIRSCPPGFPPGRYVLRPSVAVAPPDHNSISWGALPQLQGSGPVFLVRWISTARFLERCWWWPSSVWVPCNSYVREATMA